MPSRVAQPVLQSGTVLGQRYEILALLGEGGMGAVYKAHDREVGQLVALKTIRPELASNRDAIERFKQELVLARRVTHQNVIRIYDLAEADGIKFITMEYVDAKDLRTVIRAGDRLPVQETVEVIRQTCYALEAAHNVGVIHRDLKPENMVRDKSGRILVMDFGLARTLEGTGMTQTGAMLGTLEYMSPEQALGQPLDCRSDIFTLGLVFYEMLIGRLPFVADSALASLVKRTRERIVPLCDQDPSIPQSLSRIVSKCLEQDPSLRYQSASEILEDLDHWQDEEAATSVAPTGARRGVPRPSSWISSSQARRKPRQISPTLQSSSKFRILRAPILHFPPWVWISVIGVVLVAGITPFLIPKAGDSVLQMFSGKKTTLAGIPSLEEGKHVIVLPFDVQGDRGMLGYVAGGLEEELSRKLSVLMQLHVVPASSAKEQATEQKIDLNGPADKIARNFGINLIVRGTVQEGGGWTRITVKFDDVADARELLTESFSYPTAAIKLLEVDDQVYKSIVRKLGLRPGNAEQRRTANPTNNDDAYDHYLQGQYALSTRKNIEGVQAAIGFYESAIQADPRFVLAHARLSDAYRAMYELTRKQLWVQKAVESAHDAQQLNHDLAEVHLALGDIYSKLGQTEEAIPELNQAKELSPNSDVPWLSLGKTYESAGQSARAIDAYMKATQVNPYSLVDINELGAAYFNFSEFENALAQFRRVVELDPGNYQGYINIGAIHLTQGKYQESIRDFHKALGLSHDAANGDALIHSNLGTAYFYLRRYTDAVNENEIAVRIAPNRYDLRGNLADSYRWAGNKVKASAAYEAAIELATEELKINPKDVDALGSLGLYYAKSGNLVRAADFIRESRSIDPSRSDLIYNEATIEAIAKRETAALKALKLALEKGYPSTLVAIDPEFGRLRNKPEFQNLLKEYSGT